MFEPFPTPPPGGYKIVLADPPWRFRVYGKDGQAKAPEAHYKTMCVQDLLALNVGAIAADNSFLAMWVYDPMLPGALALADAWGFKFVTVLFRWLKRADNGNLAFGLGYHTRGGGCEECWLFKRGKGLPVLNHSIRKEFYSARREHSRKPDEVRGWLVDLYGDAPRIELFARATAPGWDAWGLEVNKFNEALHHVA